MGIGEARKQVSSTLIELANKKGYITYDDILKNADSASLPIDEVERLCEIVISEGIIIRDNDELVIRRIVKPSATVLLRKIRERSSNPSIFV
ncbi:hypothetical protein HF638_27620, partial [Paenibacillus sp. SZ31]|uniref:RNA ligase family protein n=1 Tax=Paenibacillus sp. SZ31 TaxID=2725555 RepID=UPI00146CB38B